MKWCADNEIEPRRTFKGKKGLVMVVLGMGIGYLFAAALLWGADLKPAALTIVVIVTVGSLILLREIWR